METVKTQMALLNIVRGWTQTDVMNFLVTNNLKEYMCFADNKCLDGYKLLVSLLTYCCHSKKISCVNFVYIRSKRPYDACLLKVTHFYQLM